MSNPLLTASSLPYQLPDFGSIRIEHFREGFEAGFAQQLAEIEQITGNPDEPTFANTIIPLERSGEILTRTSNNFFHLTLSHTNDELDALEADIAPALAAHGDAITLNEALFARLAAVYADRESLDDEDRYLVERYFTEFTRRGANLNDADKARLRDYNKQLAALTTDFGKRLMADSNDSAVVFDHAEELDGLSQAELSACAAVGKSRGMDGKYVVTLVLPTAQPALSQLHNRESRRRIHEASVERGNRNNANDTNDVVLQLVRVRADRASLLGFATHAAYAVADQTAQTPEAIEDRLYSLPALARRNADDELASLQEYADRLQDSRGEPRFELAAYDWAYYADLVRAEKYAIDTAALRPYFEYERVLRDGVFYAATALYGLTFTERPDLPGYHPDVRVFEVFDADGTGLGLFLHDVYARDSKRGGAWMNNLVDQSTLLGARPVICNNLNVPKPAGGEPTLLTLDEVRTMFHEFGHAIHGLLADTRYAHVSGTSVPRDFVEFPSQVNEMWIQWPEVIANYARHFQTGEALDRTVLDRLREAEQFNQGFETCAYLGAALLDQEWHKTTADTPIESVQQFEHDVLERLGLDSAVIPPRYRTTYFNHIFSSGYDAGYYSYIWSEVLDADTVQWFEQNGGLTRENGEHFRAELLRRGRSRDPLESYRAFRGRDALLEPLLQRRGLG